MATTPKKVMQGSGFSPHPTNPLVTAMLTDLYQITMAYAHWTNKKHEQRAVFEVFFRKCPFGGEFTVVAGLDECLRHLSNFCFQTEDIDYLKSLPALQHCEQGFFDWMAKLDARDVTVHALKDGTICFPRIPMLIVEAPLAVGQLLETTILTLIGYPSLVATNAARMVRAARLGHLISSLPGEPVCVEFGLRRAQGPDGGFSASKYSYMGGFAGTSNVLAGKILGDVSGISVSGTHAHAFVQSYRDLNEVKKLQVPAKKADGSILGVTIGDSVRLLPLVKEYRQSLSSSSDPGYARTNDGELAAFIAYAAAFPHNFLCLIDTYDTLFSGLLNFLLVALVLDDLGYQPSGVRLDSGDLAFLSKECVKKFQTFAPKRQFVQQLVIVASNDINEERLDALGEENHAINIFGIGTNLVTCQKQPALGCVYKLVELDGKPRMKLSNETEKVLIPRLKKAYRLFGKDGMAILDVLCSMDDPVPAVGQSCVCRHAFIDRERARVVPTKVEPLHHLVFSEGVEVPRANRGLDAAREAIQESLNTQFRADVLRLTNPTPYKVTLSAQLYDFFHMMWQNETPMAEYS